MIVFSFCHSFDVFSTNTLALVRCLEQYLSVYTSPYQQRSSSRNRDSQKLLYDVQQLMIFGQMTSVMVHLKKKKERNLKTFFALITGVLPSFSQVKPLVKSPPPLSSLCQQLDLEKLGNALLLPFSGKPEEGCHFKSQQTFSHI